MTSLSWSGSIAVRCALDAVEVAVPVHNTPAAPSSSGGGDGSGSVLPPPVILQLPRGAYLPQITKHALVRYWSGKIRCVPSPL